VVGRGNRHRLNIFSFEQLAIVSVRLSFSASQTECATEMRLVDVTNSDDVTEFSRLPVDCIASTAQANGPDNWSIVLRFCANLAVAKKIWDERRSCRHTPDFKKVPPNNGRQWLGLIVHAEPPFM
jgi:hypothetical protein